MKPAANPAMVVKFRPTGPWRIGPDSGASDRVDLIYHSDSLYSAVTAAMASLGFLEEWLADTAGNAHGSAVRFSSMFPFHNEIGYVVPPRSVWPPPALGRVRWKGARFIPLGLVQPLLSSHVLDEARWAVDGVSECLVPAGRPGPFRFGVRSATAMDRLGAGAEPHSVKCVEFLPGAGLWAIIGFADDTSRERWSDRVRATLRLLADSGFGGRRSRGWGRSEQPEFVEGRLPEMILAPQPEETIPEPAWWLLSLFVPGPDDAIDWQRGNYRAAARNGRVESPARSGELKKSINTLIEGSVLLAPGALRGAAVDVAPDGFPHPVYRSGFALAVPVPWQAS